MCGRYTVFDEDDIVEMKKIIDEVEKRYFGSAEEVQGSFAPDGSAEFISSPIKKGEIFPTDNAPVLLPVSEGKGSTAVPMRWGFPKAQTIYTSGKGVIINARSETADKLPIFRRCLLERRIIVPSTGYYEWEHNDSRKRKFLFREENDKMLYMAGLFNLFSDGFSEYPAFVILTRDADETVSRFHNRMPVILPKERLEEWLYNDKATGELLNIKAKLIPLLAEAM